MGRGPALLAGFIVAGAGVGLVNPALASTAIGVVPPQRSGMASGINNTFRQVGIATGIAALGDFESTLTNQIAPKLAHTPAAGHAASIADVVAGRRCPGAGKGTAHARAAAALAIRGAYANAMSNVLLVGAIVALAGAVLAVVLVRRSDFVGYGAASQAPEACGSRVIQPLFEHRLELAGCETRVLELEGTGSQC